MGERFNATGTNGRDCPVCYRTGTLRGERGADAAVLKCGGCFTVFRLDSSRPFGQLERIPLHVVDPAGYNAGARVADDIFSDCCGKRGVRGICSSCARAA